MWSGLLRLLSAVPAAPAALLPGMRRVRRSLPRAFVAGHRYFRTLAPSPRYRWGGHEKDDEQKELILLPGRCVRVGGGAVPRLIDPRQIPHVHTVFSHPEVF